jgi:hypothetical protein
VDADALAPMEDLDGSRGDPHVDLGADDAHRWLDELVLDRGQTIESIAARESDQPPETGPGRMLVHGWPVG